ncbi:hypothetical protein BGX38DRAFT_1144700 [Terfezia claveryi]|nr:hypothetical protein BGX38DRAFT_1144700 [Terfezia claveryi]
MCLCGEPSAGFFSFLRVILCGVAAETAWGQPRCTLGEVQGIGPPDPGGEPSAGFLSLFWGSSSVGFPRKQHGANQDVPWGGTGHRTSGPGGRSKCWIPLNLVQGIILLFF